MYEFSESFGQTVTDRQENRLYSGKFTLTIYFRLFIAELFPELDKAVYIDSDTVINDDIAKLLRAAEHGEFQEYDDVYPNFAKVAKEEGFIAISNTFKNIAEVEKKHGERFGKYADMIEKDTLYNREEETIWMCTNCGYIYEGKSAPNACPVCSYPKGYFIEFEESPFE